MTMIEFGKQNQDTVLLLHGGGLSWWNYREVAKFLEDYHVILPILDGHADSDAPFTTIEDNATRIIDFIDRHLDGKVTVLGGLSLGGQVALEMLAQRPNICQYALIESALVKPMKLTSALIGPTFWHELRLDQTALVCQVAGMVSWHPQETF